MALTPDGPLLGPDGVLAGQTPSVADVAALISSRTKVGMAEVGTFTDDTRPTATQVETLIAKAARLTLPSLGTLPDRLASAAADLIAIRTAVMVEMSYFPEQADTPQSMIPMLEAMYAEALKGIRESIDHDGPQGYRVGSLEVGVDL